MDINVDMRRCVEREPDYRAVKFSKLLIEGYDCSKVGCGLFSDACKKCQWNTQTPFITIDNGKIFVCRTCESPCTGFEVNEDFYIVRDEVSNTTQFISSKEFNKKYEYMY